jgi:hypothetical protein
MTFAAGKKTSGDLAETRESRSANFGRLSQRKQPHNVPLQQTDTKEFEVANNLLSI